MHGKAGQDSPVGQGEVRLQDAASVLAAALFDLEADPGEHDDVRLTNRARYAWLGRILAARIALPPSLEDHEDTDVRNPIPEDVWVPEIAAVAETASAAAPPRASRGRSGFAALPRHVFSRFLYRGAAGICSRPASTFFWRSR